MFIRTKTRKNSHSQTIKYAYLVKSKRRKKSKGHPKQKIVAYFGKVIALSNHQQSSTIINSTMPSQLVRHMLKELLLSNGFRHVGHKSRHIGHIFLKDSTQVDLSKKTVKSLKTGQRLCLQVNDGFISGHTLGQILSYKPPEANERDIGKDLAKKMLLAGLNPSKEAFLEVYTAISKDFHWK